jgi:hypothetical protein
VSYETGSVVRFDDAVKLIATVERVFGMSPTSASWSRRDACRFMGATVFANIFDRQAKAAPRLLANDAYRPDYGLQKRDITD